MQHWAPPQYSADGRWWWNGQAWVPVTWPVTWDPGDERAPDEPADEWTQRTGRRRRTPRVFWVGLLALLLLLFLAMGGGAVSWVVQRGLGLGLGA
ncbi:MAG TPA: hypothetical protein VLW53_08610, partial [Candidatus Eisenbacteria bacterium]|nr:hypothetical protein [Candidatus Eisenbacteria bacterium]